MAGSTGRFKSGYGPLNHRHGYILISLEFDSHLSGVNQDKISLTKSKTAHNVFPLFSGRKGAEGSLFFSHSALGHIFFRIRSNLTRGQAGRHLFPVTNIVIMTCGEVPHTKHCTSLSCLMIKVHRLWRSSPSRALIAIVSFEWDSNSDSGEVAAQADRPLRRALALRLSTQSPISSRR